MLKRRGCPEECLSEAMMARFAAAISGELVDVRSGFDHQVFIDLLLDDFGSYCCGGLWDFLRN